ncbi:MAG: helix-turn-helix transcriptional regulator [Lachnospiraceae bacterium]|nr:helix-turn-helix transcriptional regulator [Lachnospiraceae bacterium]
MLNQRLIEKNMSVYRCSKLSGIPYSTLRDLLQGKTQIGNCTADTLYRLSKILDVSMEELLLESKEYRCNFETFKSNVCHYVKVEGDIDFIVETLQSRDIRQYWDRKWYPEAFYMLAMVDYLSRENNLPLCEDYDDIRSCSLKEPLYPRDVSLAAKISPELDQREQCKKEAIPEFKRFNIMESEVRDVC